jgi:hypothetical protein
MKAASKTINILAVISIMLLVIITALSIAKADHEEFFVWRLESSHGWLLLLVIIIEGVLPLSLVNAAVHWRHSHRSRYFGIGGGLIIALWSTSLFVTLPYLGLYPNLIGLTICRLVFGDSCSDIYCAIPIIATNVILWPCICEAILLINTR